MFPRVLTAALVAVLIPAASAAAASGAGLGDLQPASSNAPATAPAAPGPYAGLTWARIPARYGRQGHGLRYWVSLAHIPRDVPRDRWRAIARVAGARWGMHAIGDTNRPATTGDGYPEVGFARLPKQLLGLQLTLYFKHYRLSRSCSRTTGRCVVTRRYLGRKLFDRDVFIRSDVPWDAGPATPDLRHYDLESVVLHEMGHLAGNPKHNPTCTPAPLENGLAPGWWWRGPNDYSFLACLNHGPAPLGDASPSSPSGAAGSSHTASADTVVVQRVATPIRAPAPRPALGD